MKKYLLSLLSLLLLPNAADAAIHLQFQVAHPTLQQVAVVYQTTVQTVQIGDDGKGSLTIDDLDAVHAHLYYGQASRDFFMEDGDSLSFTFDGNDFAGTLRQEGDKRRIFRYLNSVILQAPDVQEYRRPYDEYRRLVAEKEAEALQLFEAAHFEKLSPRFAAIEKGRIRYGYASNLMMYVAAHPMLTKEPWTPTDLYNADIKAYAVEEPGLAGLREYREYMKEAARIYNPQSVKGESLYDTSLKQMKWFAENIQNDTLRETLINVVAVEYVDQMGTAHIEELKNLQAVYVTLPALTRQFDRACAVWDVTAPGRPSPEIIAETVDGTAVHLSDFRGKYVFIDIWATWCAPCRKQFPHLKRLEETFKGRNIVFLGLSTDSDKEAWRKMAPTLSGIQAHIGSRSEFARSYKIEGIPHFILLDREGRIINNAMTRPSDAETEAVLKSLDGI